MTTSATEFFESGSIKASKFTIESIKRIKSLESHSDTTQSGLDFLDDFKSKFNYNEPSVELDEQVKARLDFVLKNDSKLFEQLLNYARENSFKQMEKIDKSISAICNNDGNKLHHFKPLSRKVLIQNMAQARKNNEDMGKVKKSFIEAHCSLIEDEPYSDSNLGIYAAIGAGMLATGVFAPVGLGVVMASGGIALAGVGLYESQLALNLVNQSAGLSVAELVDKDRARRDLSDFRVAAGWSVADGILFPLDALVVGGRVVKSITRNSKKVKNVNEGSVLSFKNNLSNNQIDYLLNKGISLNVINSNELGWKSLLDSLTEDQLVTFLNKLDLLPERDQIVLFSTLGNLSDLTPIEKYNLLVENFKKKPFDINLPRADELGESFFLNLSKNEAERTKLEASVVKVLNNPEYINQFPFLKDLVPGTDEYYNFLAVYALLHSSGRWGSELSSLDNAADVKATLAEFKKRSTTCRID